MEETPQHKKTPRDLLRAVFRRRLLFLTGAAVFAFAALVGANWWPVKYTAKAKLQRRADAASEDITRGKSDSFDTVKMTLQHELIGLRAVDEAADALEKKGLLPPLPRDNTQKLTTDGRMLRQQLVKDLMDDLKVTFEVRSTEVDLVSVEFTDREPRLAQELPNTLVTNYITRIGEQMVSNLTSSRDFLQTKVTEASNRLKELTGKRLEFETQYPGALPESYAALQREIQRLDSDMRLVRRQEAQARQKLDQAKKIREILSSSPARALPSPPNKEGENAPGKDSPPAAPAEGDLVDQVQSLDRELAETTQELSRLLDQKMQYERARDEGRTISHMTEKHPRMQALERQIKDTDGRIEKVRADLKAKQAARTELVRQLKDPPPRAVQSPTSADAIADPFRQRSFDLGELQLAMTEQSAQTDLEAAVAERERLEASQVPLKKAEQEYANKRQDYVEILRKVSDQQAEVDRWQKRLTEVQMALAAEAAKFRTHLSQVELAQEQFRPSSPKLAYVLAFAVLGGLAFGSGLVFLANTMDRSLATTEEAANHFGLPILGTIGEIITPRAQSRRKLIRWGLSPVAVALTVAAIGLAALNITLWLNYREKFEAWKHAPVSFVWNAMTGKWDALKDRL